jgi:hypothetical protein
VTARYQLSPLRDARARDERVKRADLADAAEHAHDLASTVEDLTGRVARGRAAIAGACAQRDQLLARGTTAAAVVRLEHHARRLRRALDAALDELRRAEARHRDQLQTVDTARDRLIAARGDREVIERHFAAWRGEQRKLADRRDD